MSRCFPYPPPGFDKSLASIEPIKLQKEKEKAKKERKKEKEREKKEKKEKARGDKGRAEAERHGHKKRQYTELSQSTHKTRDAAKTREDESEQLEKSSLTEEQGHGHKKRQYTELSQSTHKTRDATKTREDESEQLEKSSLTEEQGSPAAVQSLCDSSDSTQNSCKRSKHDSAGAIRIIHGNGLRIRLPLSRHKDTESPIPIGRPCFSGRTEAIPAQRETKPVVRHEPPPSTEQPRFSGRTGATPSEEFCQNADGKPAPVEPCRVHRSGSRSSRDRDTRRLYKKLIMEWNPPPLQAESPEDDDQDWLFGKTGSRRRRQHGEGEARGGQVAGEDAGGLGGALCSWPPRACLLPEVGIYALPYVVPF